MLLNTCFSPNHTLIVGENVYIRFQGLMLHTFLGPIPNVTYIFFLLVLSSMRFPGQNRLHITIIAEIVKSPHVDHDDISRVKMQDGY